MSFPSDVVGTMRGRNLPGGPPPGGRPLRRLNLNESPFPPSPRAVAAMQAACESVNRYPDPRWHDLVAAIAARTGIAPGRMVLGNGSDELIKNAAIVALSPGEEVLAPIPSFPGYGGCAAIGGARLVTAPVRDDGAADVDAMAAAIGPHTAMVILATPNNPTGGMLPTEQVMRLAEAVPDTALLVLDEAYHEFAMHAGGEDHLDALAGRRGPWVSFRTFSKAYGLAGIRIGYALAGSDEVAQAFQAVRSPFTVNAVAQAGALAAWQDLAHRDWILERTRVERERILEGLLALGAKPYPSVANFVTARTRVPAADVLAALADAGILIARLAAPGYSDHIRVTVGDADDTDALLAAFGAVLG